MRSKLKKQINCSLFGTQKLLNRKLFYKVLQPREPIWFSKQSINTEKKDFAL